MADTNLDFEKNFDIPDPKDNKGGKATGSKGNGNKKLLSKDVLNPLWLSVSESAKLGGVTSKTIRRALQSQKLTYKIIKNRYLIDLRSVVKYLHTNKKLKNKLKQNGIGQYIDKWRE